MVSISQYYFNHAKFEKSIEDFFADRQNKFVRIESPADDARVNEAGAVVFVHTTNYDFWIQKASDNPLTRYILVSSFPSSLMALSVGHFSNLYICEISVKEFHGDKQIKTLMECLRGGVFNSSLLRRVDLPAKVAEAYVLLRAREAGVLGDSMQLGNLSAQNIWQSAAESSPEFLSQLPGNWDEFWSMHPERISEAISCVKRVLKQQTMSDMSDVARAILALPLTEETRRLAAIRSRLRHSWLENQILNRDSSVVAGRHGTSTKASVAFKWKICANGEFAQATKEVRELCDIMLDTLSPARLLDRKPLSLLSEQCHRQIADELHRLYLKRSRVEKSRTELQTAIVEFEVVLAALCRLWNVEPRVERDVVKTAFERLQCIGLRLHAALGVVPQGTVLP
jgi:hypothetical protein